MTTSSQQMYIHNICIEVFSFDLYTLSDFDGCCLQTGDVHSPLAPVHHGVFLYTGVRNRSNENVHDLLCPVYAPVIEFWGI